VFNKGIKIKARLFSAKVAKTLGLIKFKKKLILISLRVYLSLKANFSYIIFFII
jgi:hypothetical protein